MSDELPPLPEAYAAYLTIAYTRASSVTQGPVTDFVNWLREKQLDAHYSDEEWIAFLTPFVGDEDKARDLWDALLCQPSYDH